MVDCGGGDRDYASLLAECGFIGVQCFPSLTGGEDDSQYGLLAVLAHRGP